MCFVMDLKVFFLLDFFLPLFELHISCLFFVSALGRAQLPQYYWYDHYFPCFPLSLFTKIVILSVEVSTILLWQKETLHISSHLPLRFYRLKLRFTFFMFPEGSGENDVNVTLVWFKAIFDIDKPVGKTCLLEHNTFCHYSNIKRFTFLASLHVCYKL